MSNVSSEVIMAVSIKVTGIPTPRPTWQPCCVPVDNKHNNANLHEIEIVVVIMSLISESLAIFMHNNYANRW